MSSLSKALIAVRDAEEVVHLRTAGVDKAKNDLQLVRQTFLAREVALAAAQDERQAAIAALHAARVEALSEIGSTDRSEILDCLMRGMQ